MTDFRTLMNQPHDLRSQLGLIPGRRAEEFTSILEAIAEPLSPDQATPAPLVIAMGGTTTAAQAARQAEFNLHQQMLRERNKNAGVVVNVTSSFGDEPLDAAEIAASIRKMIDSPEVRRMRTIGALSDTHRAGGVINAYESLYGNPSPKRSIKLDQTPISEILIDVRAIADLIPPGSVLIKGFTLEQYLAALPGTEPVTVKEGDITAAKELTPVLASTLRGLGLFTAADYSPTHRTLGKILAHVENLESDILEMLVMAGANPNTDVRRLAAARTQFELAFMMMKKAVDPEQARQ